MVTTIILDDKNENYFCMKIMMLQLSLMILKAMLPSIGPRAVIPPRGTQTMDPCMFESSYKNIRAGSAACDCSKIKTAAKNNK